MNLRIRPREAGDQAAAQAFLARHGSARVARLGELVHPLDHPAFVVEAADGRLLGCSMLAIVLLVRLCPARAPRRDQHLTTESSLLRMVSRGTGRAPDEYSKPLSGRKPAEPS